MYISKIGYTNEKNHAFFPGFPMVLNAINQYIQMANGKSKFDPEYDLGSDAMFLKFAFSLQMAIGSANAVLIYKLGVHLMTLSLFNGTKENQNSSGIKWVEDISTK